MNLRIVAPLLTLVAGLAGTIAAGPTMSNLAPVCAPPANGPQLQAAINTVTNCIGSAFDVTVSPGSPSPTNPGFTRFDFRVAPTAATFQSVAFHHVEFSISGIDPITGLPLEFVGPGDFFGGNPNDVSYEMSGSVPGIGGLRTGVLPGQQVAALPGLDFKFHLRHDAGAVLITAGLTTSVDIKLPTPGSKFVVNAEVYGGKGTLPTRILP